MATKTAKPRWIYPSWFRSTMKHDYVVRLIPPAHAHGREEGNLIAAMHSLVLDERHPLALEMVGTSEQRSFLIRSMTQEGLDHAITQLRARYPQADMRSISPADDPFHVGANEIISAVELKAGAASYLPLRSWNEEEQQNADPLLGVLGALDAIPEGIRVLAQLALVPASVTWSQHDQRKAIEHALEPERQQERRDLATEHHQTGEHAPSLPFLVLGGILLLGLVTYGQWKTWLPSSWFNIFTTWLYDIITPHAPSPVQAASLSFPFLILFGVVAVLFIGMDQLRRKYNRKPLYDQALVGQKTSQMAYRVLFRLYAISAVDSSVGGNNTRDVKRALVQLEKQHEVFLARLIAAYRQYHLASGNYFVPKRLSAQQALRCVQGYSGQYLLPSGWWCGLRWSRHLMSVETLASLWHLPMALLVTDLALLEQITVRTLPLPVALAQQPAQGVPIGTAYHAGHRLPVTLPDEALQAHLFVGGKSGEGKSTCLEYLACKVMEQGGLVVIDPHGDLVDHILALVPEQRAEDVVLLDLSNEAYVVGFNPLDASVGRGRDKAVADLLKTLAHIWSSSWGSRMENAFEYALRTLFEANRVLVARGEPQRQYTLLDVMLVLTDEHFCHALLNQITDPFILRWWNLYYDPLNPLMQRERSDPVLSKVAKFESLLARRIVGQATSTVNFSECIQQEKILLVKLAKGVVGEDVARLLGATLLGLLQITLEEQGNLGEEQRKHLCILIDEFQTLKGVDWAALAELRKYGAAFYLATQSLAYLADMDASLLHVVLANVKQYIVFHMSAEDAQGIHGELGVEAEDIVNLDRYMCYVKLLCQQHRQPAFSMTLSPPLYGDQRRADQIRQASQQKYTVAADVVDERVREALAASLMLMPALDDDDRLLHQNGALMEVEAEQSPVGLARQDHGYRGRKSEEKRAKGKSPRSGDRRQAVVGAGSKNQPEGNQVHAGDDEAEG